MLEAIISDPHGSHSDRLRADDALRELERDDARRGAVEHMSPEQALEEARSLSDAMPGIVTCARVAAGEDAQDVVEPPTEVDDLRELVELQQQVLDAVEQTLAERERGLQRLTAQRLLPPAPPTVSW